MFGLESCIISNAPKFKVTEIKNLAPWGKLLLPYHPLVVLVLKSCVKSLLLN